MSTTAHNPGIDEDDDWEIRSGTEAYEDEAKQSAFSFPDFFFMKEGSETKGVFADRDFREMISVDLHGWFSNDGKNGKPRKHFATCLSMRWNVKALAEKGFRVAPCCSTLGPISQSMDRNLGFQTLIDGTSFTDKNGNKRQFEMRLYPINKGVYKYLDSAYKDWGRLSGWVIKFKRVGDKSPRVGTPTERDIDKNSGTVVSKDYDALFNVVMFRGKLLSKLYDDAETEIAERAAKIAELTEANKTAEGAAKTANEKQIARLQEPGDWTRYVLHYFRVRVIDGKIVAVDKDNRPMPGKDPKNKNRTVPVFNYKKIFKPLDPEEFMRLYGHMEGGAGALAEGTPDVKTGGTTRTDPGASDDLPF